MILRKVSFDEKKNLGGDDDDEEVVKIGDVEI